MNTLAEMKGMMAGHPLLVVYHLKVKKDLKKQNALKFTII